MKWAYSIKNKTTAALVLFVLLGLIAFNNYRENHISDKMKQTVNSLYKDRLWAEFLISEIRFSIHLLREKDVNMEPHLNRIHSLNTQFAHTYLTQNEKVIFDQYLAHNQAVMNQYALSKGISDSDLLQSESYLQSLHETQIIEGQNLVSEMEEMHKSAALMSQFEVSLLILVGIIVQVLILTSKSLKKVFKPGFSQWN